MSGVFRFDVEDWTKEHEDGEDREIKQSVVQQKQQQEQQQQHVLLNSVSASPPLNAEWKVGSGVGVQGECLYVHSWGCDGMGWDGMEGRWWIRWRVWRYPHLCSD